MNYSIQCRNGNWWSGTIGWKPGRNNRQTYHSIADLPARLPMKTRNGIEWIELRIDGDMIHYCNENIETIATIYAER